MTDKSKEIVRVPCIHYPVSFLKCQRYESQRQESQEQVRILFDSDSKINAMNPTFAQKLGLHIRKTNVGAQKIDDSTLEIFEMVIINF